MSLRAFAEISPDGKRIEVHFPYSEVAVRAVKEVPGYRFVSREKDRERGPYWTVPLDMPTGKALRAAFGDGLRLGEALRSWGIQEKRRQRELRTLALADDAELVRVPKTLPRVAAIINGEPLDDFYVHVPADSPLRRKRDPRPYQRADIAMMARGPVLNGNQPGTGKTIEYIGAVAEGDRLDGAQLIVAPVTSHVDTWVHELLVCEVPGTILYGLTPDERRDAIREAAATQADNPEEPIWLILGFDDIRVTRAKANSAKEWNQGIIDPSETRPVVKKDHKGRAYVAPTDEWQTLRSIKFKTFCVDESHKTGLPNPDSLFAIGANLINSEVRYSMSGTPMGGKPIRLWGHLRWLDKETYGSKWRWAERYLKIDDNGFGKTIGGIKPGMEEDFYAEHAHYMVRREKRDALPGLPPKVIIEVPTPMTAKQKKAYDKFFRDAEIRIDGERLSATNVLAEYSRLKQFANAACTLERKRNGDLRVIPTPNSGKLPKLLEKLDENGVRKTEPEPRARAIVGSESLEMIQMTADWLRDQGLRVVELHGDVKPKDRQKALDDFRSDDEEPIILAMTIQTGGVSLNLEMANSIHALDETWNPDDMEQFEDRGDRGSRTTPLRCYYYRTPGTIQEYIHEIAGDKAITNKNIMDVRRKMYKAKTEDK